MTPAPKKRTPLRRQLPALAWLTLVWVLLWGSFTWANIVGGMVVAVLVVTLTPMPALDLHGRLRLGPLAVLLGRFVTDLFTASFQVAAEAFRAISPAHRPQGGVVGVQLRTRADLYLTVTAELSSLVPGSLVVEVHRLTGMLYLHVLDVERSGGVDQVRADTLALEERVLRAMASDDELAELGLTPYGRTTAATPDELAAQQAAERVAAGQDAGQQVGQQVEQQVEQQGDEA